MQNELGNMIDATEYKASYDLNAKKLIAYKPILAQILRETVTEFRGMSTDEVAARIRSTIVEGVCYEPGMTNMRVDQLSTENSFPGEGKVFFDLLCTVVTTATDPVNSYVYINTEIQRDAHPGYDLSSRGVFYCARQLSMQYGKEISSDNYNGMKKVYSIWLSLGAPKKYSPSITRYYMEKEDLFGNYQGHEKYDYLETVIIRIPSTVPSGTKDGKSSAESMIDMVNVVLSNFLSASEKKNAWNRNTIFQSPKR